MMYRSMMSTILLAIVLVVAGCSDTTAQPAPKADNEAAAKPDEHGAAEEEHGSENENHDKDAGGHDEHEEEEGADRVHLTAEQRERLKIEVAKAKSGSATAIVTAPATVQFDSDRVARIGPRLSAKVLEVTADLGTRVEAGDTVAILDSVELGQAKANYLTAAARYGTRLAAYQRNKKLAQDKIISEAALLESRAAYSQARAERDAARSELKLYGLDDAGIDAIGRGSGTPLSRYPLTTPIAGVVQRRDLLPGQTISATETPIHVVDNSRMWVIIEAYEADLARLDTGQSIKLNVRPLPDQTFTGKTNWISQELDEQARTVRLRATVDNPEGLLRAGMFGTARIQTDAEQRFALVPVDAVQSVADDDVVFVPGHEPGAFKVVSVTTGDEGDGLVEIRSGLAPGDPVVTAGAFDLKSALTASGRSAAHSH